MEYYLDQMGLLPHYDIIKKKRSKMTETLTKLIIDCSTGESQTVPLTEEEIQDMQDMASAAAVERAAHEAELGAKAEAKASAASKLAALGLTPEEIAAITS
jgi:hypothetical protein